MSYATRDDLAAYAPQVIGTDDVLDEILLQASTDIDRFLGVLPRSRTATPPFKFDLSALDAFTAEGLTRATCAQAEFRHHMGPDYFLDLPGTVTQGPDFTITTGGGSGGGSGMLGSKTVDELLSYGLLRTSARSRP